MGAFNINIPGLSGGSTLFSMLGDLQSGRYVYGDAGKARNSGQLTPEQFNVFVDAFNKYTGTVPGERPYSIGDVVTAPGTPTLTQTVMAAPVNNQAAVDAGRAGGVVSAGTAGLPGLSDAEVAASLGMEYTGERDMDQMVQDAVEQARGADARATGTAPSEADIAQRTQQFEETIAQLRADPAMQEQWFGVRDTRKFDLSPSDILKVAASFAIPFAAPAVAGALASATGIAGLGGAVGTTLTQAALSGGLAAATGDDPLKGALSGALLSNPSQLGAGQNLFNLAQRTSDAFANNENQTSFGPPTLPVFTEEDFRSGGVIPEQPYDTREPPVEPEEAEQEAGGGGGGGGPISDAPLNTLFDELSQGVYVYGDAGRALKEGTITQEQFDRFVDRFNEYTGTLPGERPYAVGDVVSGPYQEEARQTAQVDPEHPYRYEGNGRFVNVLTGDVINRDVPDTFVVGDFYGLPTNQEEFVTEEEVDIGIDPDLIVDTTGPIDIISTPAPALPPAAPEPTIVEVQPPTQPIVDKPGAPTVTPPSQTLPPSGPEPTIVEVQPPTEPIVDKPGAPTVTTTPPTLPPSGPEPTITEVSPPGGGGGGGEGGGEGGGNGTGTGSGEGGGEGTGTGEGQGAGQGDGEGDGSGLGAGGMLAAAAAGAAFEPKWTELFKYTTLTPYQKKAIAPYVDYIAQARGMLS